MRIKTATLSIIALAAGALATGTALADTKIGVVNVTRLLQESPQARPPPRRSKANSPPAAANSRPSRRTSRPRKTS